RPQ
ncbi:adhesin, partial [Escherichia coli N1]